MKPTEIRNFVFDKGAFGYRAEEVEACLNDIADFVEKIQKQNENLQKQVKSQEERIGHLQEDEDSVKQIIVSAQKLSTTVTSEAKAKADQLLTEATAKSESLLSDASAKSSTMVAEATAKAERIEKEAVGNADQKAREIQKKADLEEKRFKTMQKEVTTFKAELLKIYKAHLDLITKLPELEEKEESVMEQEAASAPFVATASAPAAPKQSKEMEATKSFDVSKPEEGSAKKDGVAVSPFKITITETKDKEKSKDKDLEALQKQKAKENRFNSRFGELKFGESSKLNKD